MLFKLIFYFLLFTVSWLLSLGLIYLAGVILGKQTGAWKTKEDFYKEHKIIYHMYRVTLLCASLFFYLSVPILLIIYLLLGSIILFFSLYTPNLFIPIILMLFLAFPLSQMVKSLFIRKHIKSPPGIELPREKYPQLWEYLDSIATEIGVSPLDKARITACTEIAVIEQGGLLKKIKKKSEKTVVLGIGLLHGMNLSQFKAILGHEFSHFKDKEYFRITTEQHIQFSLLSLIQAFRETNLNSRFNLAWLYIALFYRLFMRITKGAWRTREYQADKSAAEVYGSQNVIDALEFALKQNLNFREIVKRAGMLLESTTQNELGNIYRDMQIPKPKATELEQEYNSILKADTDPRDTHPSYKDRISYLKLLNLPNYGDYETLKVSSLFPDFQILQDELGKGVINELIALTPRSLQELFAG